MNGEQAMRFDVNQTEFPSKFHKDVWQTGVAVLPLEITLTGIDNPETREGLTQIYSFMLELLHDMYNNPDKYDKKNINDFLRSIVNEAKIKKNDKYPLLQKYMNEFVSLVWSRKPKAAGHNWEIIQKCDFHCFSNIKVQGIDDLLYDLSDQNRVCFKELHDYVITKGGKKESGRYRYKYKTEHIICFDWKPSIFISWKLKSGNSFESFISELNKQPDKADLLNYIQNETTICNYCGLSNCKTYVEFFICTPHGRKRHHHFAFNDTKKIKIDGMELNRGCLYHLDDVTKSFSESEIKILKRLLDIRFKQIDNV